MRTRNFYKKQTRFNRTTKSKPSDGKTVKQDPQLIIDVLEKARQLDDKIRMWNLEDGINWILGFEAYVDDKRGKLSPKYQNSHIFKRGDIVLVDFFGHYGTELTYEHPAIVLADTYDGVVIAPTSSKCYKDGISTHISLDRNVPDQGDLPANCGIKLEQVRFISKRRIIQQFKRVTNNEKLDKIDEVLMSILAPYTYNSMVMEEKHLNTQLKAKDQEITDKQTEIDKLKRRIQLLESQSQEIDEDASAS